MIEEYESVYSMFQNVFQDLAEKNSNVFFKGRTNMLKQPEFDEIDKVKNIMEKLEDYENITDVFEEIYDVLSDFDGLPIGFHLITPAVSIISGASAIKEISNEEISLYSNRKNKENLFSLMSQTFYIVKEDTNEIVGMISYNFEKENISYNIKSKFRGNHYASKALSLMLELLNQNIHICEYKLYVKVLKENIPSINTALRCNLPLVKSNDSVNFYLANHEKLLTINKQ